MRLGAAVLSASLMFTSIALAAPADPPTLSFGAWGFDSAGQDTTARPGDDFNVFANGKFLSALAIPDDRSSYGVDAIVADVAERRVRGMLEAPDASGTTADADAVKTRALYRAFMDQARVDALGAAPLQPELAAIRGAKDKADLAALMGASVRGFQDSLFDLDIQADAKAPDRYVVNLTQGGLGLPDRDYYLTAPFAVQKAAYQAYVARLLRLIDWADPDASAAAVVAFETKVAQASWARADERDPNKIYNPMTPAELERFAPGFDWTPFLGAAGLAAVARLVVQENNAFPMLAALFAATPLETLKAWAAFHLADNAAPNLAARFDAAQFAFHGTVLGGQPTQKVRWKRGVALVNDAMGEAVGKVYVAKYFPPEAKARIRALVAELQASLAARIQRVDWMSDETKTRALRKLSQLTVKVAYPDRWRDYSALRIDPDDLYGDVERAQAFDWNRRLARLDGPVDRGEWEMTPQTVNAYYEPTANEIVFPAAILQAPYFDIRFDPAANYGDIGATIGHEMTHGFDDEGRDFDGTGALVNWWAPDDGPKFDQRAAALAAQFDAYAPYPGAHLNGKLTDGENIADLGGLLIALDAYHDSLHGAPAPVIDGLTGDQRFFLAYAQTWRNKRREAAERKQIVSDPHSLDRYRVNGVVRNVDAWYQAFDIQPGDKLYLPPASRVRIW